MTLSPPSSQLEVRSKIAANKEDGIEAKPAERKRRRWDQQKSEEEGPSKKKSAWDQAEEVGLGSGLL